MEEKNGNDEEKWKWEVVKREILMRLRRKKVELGRSESVRNMIKT